MRTATRIILSLALALCLGASESRASPPLSNREILAKATADLSQQIQKVLTAQANDSLKIALRATVASDFNQSFQDVLAPALLDRGWDVWILKQNQEPQAGTLLLEYKLLQASLSYPSQDHGFLGLGTPTVKRVVDLGIEGRLESPEDGQLFWQGQPSSHFSDRISVSDMQSAQTGQPTWLNTPKTDTQTTTHAGFLEKLTIAGLVGAVVALYISGAQ
jgi:hypothetical protein